MPHRTAMHQQQLCYSLTATSDSSSSECDLHFAGVQASHRPSSRHLRHHSLSASILARLPAQLPVSGVYESAVPRLVTHEEE